MRAIPSRRLAALLLTALVAAATLPSTTAATDLRGAEWVELRGLRGQLDGAPRATGYDLDRAWRVASTSSSARCRPAR